MLTILQFSNRDCETRIKFEFECKMTLNIAKDTLLETFKNLLTCEGGVKRDFIIESEDSEGEKATYHVHSSILTMRFVLDTLNSGV